MSNYEYGASKPWQAIKHWTPGRPPTLTRCAILDSDKRVLTIRSYPRATHSNNVVEIPHDQLSRVAVGWFYDPTTKRFHQ